MTGVASHGRCYLGTQSLDPRASGAARSSGIKICARLVNSIEAHL